MGRRLILDTYAAHAADTGRTVLTRDVKARFGGLPGILAIDAR